MRQRDEADLQRALAESEAARVRDEAATKSFYRDGKRPRRSWSAAPTSRGSIASSLQERYVQGGQARRATVALARWRDVAKRKREAKREARRQKAQAAEAEWHFRRQEVADARSTKEMAESELEFMEKVLTKLMPGPELQQDILEMRQVLRVAQTTIDTGGAGPSDPTEAERQKAINDRLMQQRVDRAYNRNVVLRKRAALEQAMRSWRDVARALKAKKDGKKLAEARRAAQEHCNAIFREHTKQREEAAAAMPAPPESPPPPPPPPPPAPSDPAAVTTHAEWRRDYQKELARVQADSKMQWDNGVGWAAGAHTVWLAYGGQDYVNARVRERQQWDAQCATFWANSRHMDRVRQRQREVVDESNRRELKEAADRHAAALRAEQEAHDAKQRAAEANFQAKLETISGQNASLDAFEEENRTLLREGASLFCGRLRERLRAHEPNAATSRLAPKHECVVCLDAICTHVATTCGHVIGCGACCNSLTACPICCAATTFVELRFPH